MSKMTRRGMRIAGGVLANVGQLRSAAADHAHPRADSRRCDGAMLTVTAGEAGAVKVALTDNAAVYGVVKARLADIKSGIYIGVGATPQAGRQPARHSDHDLHRAAARPR